MQQDHISVFTGNLFRTRCQTVVNTVNCVGVMGAGIALECRLRYPDMFTHYGRLCAQGQFDVGRLWLYRTPDRWILNFPTKKHWKLPSRPEYLHLGLQKFLETYQARGITSVAFPLLGALNGGMRPEESLALMRQYLSQCAIPVEIYIYDPAAPDDVFDDFKSAFLALPDEVIKQHSGLRADGIRRVREALNSPHICQLNQLAQAPGIGDRTLEKSFAFISRYRQSLAFAPAGSSESDASAAVQQGFGF